MSQQIQGQQDYNLASAKLDSDIAHCARQFPNPHAKPSIPRTTCLNDAKLNYQIAYDRYTGTVGTDLIEAQNAQALVASEAYDAGRLTPAQFDAAMSASQVEFTTATLQRQNSAVSVQAARSQAAAAESMAATQRSRAIQDALAPKNTTCTGSGNTMTCYPSY